MPDLLERLTSALADRYVIERTPVEVAWPSCSLPRSCAITVR